MWRCGTLLLEFTVELVNQGTAVDAHDPKHRLSTRPLQGKEHLHLENCLTLGAHGAQMCGQVNTSMSIPACRNSLWLRQRTSFKATSEGSCWSFALSTSRESQLANSIVLRALSRLGPPNLTIGAPAEHVTAAEAKVANLHLKVCQVLLLKLQSKSEMPRPRHYKHPGRQATSQTAYSHRPTLPALLPLQPGIASSHLLNARRAQNELRVHPCACAFKLSWI